MNPFYYPGYYQSPGYQGVPFVNQPVALTIGPCPPDSSCKPSDVSSPSNVSEETSPQQGDSETDSESDS